MMIVEGRETVVVLLLNVVQVSRNAYLECILAMPTLIWLRQVRVSPILNNVTGASTIVMHNSIPFNVLQLGPCLVWVNCGKNSPCPLEREISETIPNTGDLISMWRGLWN